MPSKKNEVKPDTKDDSKNESKPDTKADSKAEKKSSAKKVNKTTSPKKDEPKPKVNKAADQQFDLLIKRIEALEARIAVTESTQALLAGGNKGSKKKVKKGPNAWILFGKENRPRIKEEVEAEMGTEDDKEARKERNAETMSRLRAEYEVIKNNDDDSAMADLKARAKEISDEATENAKKDSSEEDSSSSPVTGEE